MVRAATETFGLDYCLAFEPSITANPLPVGNSGEWRHARSVYSRPGLRKSHTLALANLKFEAMDKTAVAVAIFDKLAKVYQDKFMDVSLYGDSFDTFCEQLPKDATVLELACGPGNITRYLLDKRPDLRIFGTDLSPGMIGLAQENNPEATFDLLDCRDIRSLTQQYNELMCGFCLPYLSKEDTVTLIADAATVLLPGGVIYISTMEDDYTKSGLEAGSSGDEIYMHYHQADYLCEALKKNGFDIVVLDRISYTAREKEVTDLLIVGKKKSATDH